MRVESSTRVAFARCTIAATDSVFIPPAVYIPAWLALRVFQSDVALYDSTVTGGRGGNGSFINATCVGPSDGGAGMVLKNGLARVMDSAFARGVAGIPGASCPGGANPCPATVVTGSSMLTIHETLRRLELSRPSFEGNVKTLHFEGVPNEPVLLLISTVATNQFVPGV